MKVKSGIQRVIMGFLVAGSVALLSYAAQPGPPKGTKLPQPPASASAASLGGSGGGDTIDPNLMEPEEVGLDPDLP